MPSTHFPRFGPFELDVRAAELRKYGIPIKLPEQSFQILLMLLETPGDVVLRSEIRQRLWPGHTVVDFDQSISSAVRRLRSALGDSADAPRYIETVAKRGYRFRGHMEETPAALSGTGNMPPHRRLPVADSSPGSVNEPAGDTLALLARGTEAPPEGLSLGLGITAGLGADTLPKSQPADHSRRRSSTMWLGLAAAMGLAILLIWAALIRLHVEAQVTGVSPVTGTGDVESANISPDGRYVAYVSGTAGHYTLWLKQYGAETGVPLIDCGPDSCGGLAFSRDGNWIYFARRAVHSPNGTLYRISTAGGYPDLILGGISGEPFLSPDGRRIAFVRSTLTSGGEDILIVVTLDGGSEREFVRYPPPGIHHNELAWTIDGKQIGYIAMGKLTVLDLASGQTRLVPDQNWFDFEGIATSPYGPNEVLLTAIRPGGPTPHQIFRIGLDDHQSQQLTHETHYRRPRATADGERILAMKDVQLRTIHVVTFDGGLIDRLVVGDAQINPSQGITWTRDGKILFASKSPDEDRGSLWMVDADGSNRRRVRQSQGDESFARPTMAADGRISAFAVWTEFDRARISVMDMVSGNLKQLSWGIQDDEPAMSPDGTWVVYRALQGKRPVLMRTRVDGGAVAQLTDYAAEMPAISPDGKWIACFAVRGNSTSPELLMLPSNGGAPVKAFALPTTVKLDMRPAWTPDGGTISYVSRIAGSSNIWNQRVEGGAPSALTSFMAQDIYHFDWSRDKRLALAIGTDSTDAMLLHVRRQRFR